MCNGEEIKLFLKHDEPRILDEVSSSPEWKLIEVSAFKLLWGSRSACRVAKEDWN